MRLGELLISAGKLTPDQVEETLKGQAIFGGRFGTNLVEMGYLDERELALFLSRKTGTPHASPDQLMEVPPHILKIIPEQMVQKYRVVPIGLNNRKLIVAMADPSNFAAIDEISFVTGYIVLPVITPELRLVNALEKHYNIRREMRYIKVAGGGRNRAKAAAQAQEPADHNAIRLETSVGMKTLELDDSEILELPMLSEIEDLDELEEYHPAQPATLYAPQPRKDYSLEAVLRGFTEAPDRHAIAELIVNYAAQDFDRAALFLLKGGKANGWVAQYRKSPVQNFEKLEISLSQPSILRVVDESKNYYLGPIPTTPANTAIVAALGGGDPVLNLAVPLIMAGRVVAILYVDGAMLRPDEKVGDLLRLLRKASMAFEILILKSKILLT